MPLPNYTTSVPAIRSLMEIQGLLAERGAEAIQIDYQDGKPTGLSFLIVTPHGKLPFRLPVRIERVQAVLTRQKVKREVTWEMASRVAWRIMKDWVRAQMAILDTEMVSLDQVFLPYLRINESGETLHDAFEKKGFLMLTQGSPS